MHVALPWNAAQVEPLTDARISGERAANRAVIVAKLMRLLEVCEREGEGSGDPRWVELQLRALDRIGRQLRLLEPEPPVARGEGVDHRAVVAVAAAALDALEAKLLG